MKFFVEDGLLPRKGINQATIRYISSDEVHFRDWGEHQGGTTLFKKIYILVIAGLPLKLMLYPFLENIKCVNSMATELMPQLSNCIVCTLWPFHIWDFDLVGVINVPSRGYIWILATKECYIKWVKAVALKRASVSTSQFH